MRGGDEQTGALFSYVSCEARVPPDHPLRLIRAVVDEALDVLSPEFDRLYARVGRPGIAPEKLLRALLLQAFYSDPVRTAVDGAAGLQPAVPLVRRLVDGRAGLGCQHVQQEPRPPAGRRRGAAPAGGRGRAASDQGAHVQRALLRRRHAYPGLGGAGQGSACAAGGKPAEGSHKSFQPKPGTDAEPPGGDDPGAPPAGRNAERNWRGQKRSNETHASTTDPDARLARKSNGQASIMAYAGHVLMENRNGLVARSCLTPRLRHGRTGRSARHGGQNGARSPDHAGRGQGL